MFGIGYQELLIIFLIILLLFGANRIPEIGRAMGKGIRDFKRATQDLEDEFKPDPGPDRHIPGKTGTSADAPSSSAKAEQKSS